MDEFTFNTERLWRLCVKCARTVYAGAVPPSPSYGETVAKFLFEIAAVESSLRWERQRTPRWEGPVGGFSKWQMERTWVERAQDTLATREDLARRAADFVFCDPNARPDYLPAMDTNTLLAVLRFNDNDAVGAALCRVGWLRMKGYIPATLEARAVHWKTYYNTYLGKGTPEVYLSAAQRLCLPTYDRVPFGSLAL